MRYSTQEELKVLTVFIFCRPKVQSVPEKPGPQQFIFTCLLNYAHTLRRQTILVSHEKISHIIYREH